jgi:DNA-binding LacI/PurR family transcriptional regulator
VVDRGLPLVVVDGPLRPGAGHVGIDDRGGAALAARHLLERGHRRLAVVSAPLSPDRYEGLADQERQAAASTRTLPVAEVAELLGCSAGAVKTHTHRGIRKLRQLLGVEAVVGVSEEERDGSRR